MVELYWSPNYNEIIRILKENKSKVVVAGVRAFFYRGIPVFRFTKDLDIVCTLVIDELREKVTKQLRSLGYNVSWRVWGLTVEKDLDRIDIMIKPIIIDEEFYERCKVLNVDGEVFIPSIEDTIILKIIASRKQDIKDVKMVLHILNREFEDRIDFAYLFKRAEQAGVKVKKKLMRYLRIAGFEV